MRNVLELVELSVFAKAGVPYIKGRPGVGKTAYAEQLAQKHDFDFYDIRLSQVDSSEVAGIPKGAIDKDTGVEYTKYLIPGWAVKANQAKKGALVFFDELNRAELTTRNAALQILNERKIGWDFKFNENVYFLAAGNLGEEDGTEVESLDNALNNRLVHFKFEPTFKDWKGFMEKNGGNTFVINYLNSNTAQLYPQVPENHEGAFATPRSWYNLSKILNMKETLSEMTILAKNIGAAYIGSANTKFVRYLEEQTTISVRDVIENFEKVKANIERVNRSRKSELINELKAHKFIELEEAQAVNVVNFLKLCDKDEVFNYVRYITSSECTDISGEFPKNLKLIKKEIPEIISVIKQALSM